ncbi:hypothetical protein O181_019806 [Austropuccinia psidii MF-1]|uniref:Tf2-1-like SH3-like domain-containing protein n=1 Tax=Austropuccinia psidii MF-1 TaxID=1389203 RepID=A0A9Q3C7Y0_9BASI|nr:hypothetical protein [Austropuccinia psidii MF-1]
MNLSFSTAYHSQTDGLAYTMIQDIWDIIRTLCVYGLEFKGSDSFTHDWCTLISALKLAYSTSVHSSTVQTPDVLGKVWNPRLPEVILRKDLIEIHPKYSSFKILLDRVQIHSNKSINDSFDYEKQRWDKSHRVPDFKVGDLVLVLTLKFTNIKDPKKLKDCYLGPFFIVALHGTNRFEVELNGSLESKQPTFPVSLISPCCQPATQNQSTCMTAKYNKPILNPRYHQTMELSQIR